ncbi:hypothetical protein NLX83_13735 [Allokutzneria sp. A3M-2-11 16]|uniref:phage tail tube protein n=1 Tax=Allokutzneria sp. A3M-2-11 16 TaxID=2962043 RepID=UPI0020B80F1D|nr:hypothetical protein [Allokutzneria sp. A3M-2-11 16]MCP3800320.1 hypothetical protein [Allokutzneria sp. A3M-2-11 16]
MSVNPGLVRVPGTGGVSLAPSGTAEPADAAVPLAAPWLGLGLTTKDGVTLKRSVEKEGTEHWQQVTPARFIYTGHQFTVAAVFQESKHIVLSAYFGGLRFAETAAGSKKYRGVISATPRSDIRSLVLNWVDQVSDTEVYRHRLWLPRCEVTETEETKITRAQESQWGMTFAALAPPDGDTLAVWLTDDPAVLMPAPADK